MKYQFQLALICIILISGCKPKNEIRPERRTIVDAVFGSGHLENAGQYTIMANADGFISKSYVHEGDTVQAGQMLFCLNNDIQNTQVANALTNLNYAKANANAGSPQITQLQIQILQGRKKLSVDSANYARYSRLVTTKAVSENDFENAKLNFQSSVANLNILKKNLDDLLRNLRLNVENAAAQYQLQKENNNFYQLSSKGPGVVMNLAKKPGDYVRRGDVIAMLGTGHTVIKLDIAEEDINRIRIGQRVLVSMNNEKDKNYEALVSKIYPAFNVTDQAFIIEAMFKTAPLHPLNGAQLQGNIIVEEKKNALVIPSSVVVNDHYVWINRQKRKINTGIRTLEWTEVTGGLSGNEVLTLPNAD
ncbi:efflux RND transporter periplasmic adaptor subunit [Mucilaginibacter sp. KACC 22063]|uniref:efflux RND transporter periplasmic adaptor subunit n=1 Tax=Mucilaginibacter sp. KACC 22063 TaxID=3025666 RepID=UPI002365F3DD|nr:efflux RND transporter periplasmic adaptor subunit [Mucilaginibacter sp. KACC 22063]WDF53694.1 efflux RND transporter periplasmic adaptor subunit [Mucilaginibacter sp. KACC 22063]